MSGKGQRPLATSAGAAGAGPKALAALPHLPHPAGCSRATSTAPPKVPAGRGPSQATRGGGRRGTPGAEAECAVGAWSCQAEPKSRQPTPAPPDQACQGPQPTRTPRNRRDFLDPKTTHTCCFWDSTRRRGVWPVQGPPGHQSSGAFPQGQSLCPGKGQPRAEAPAATGTPAPDTSLLTSITTHQFRIPR